MFVAQAEGVLFLPFEQRMTRDVQQRRERRAMRRAKGMGTSSLGSAPSQGSLGSDISKAGLLQGTVSGPSDAPVVFCPSSRVYISSLLVPSRHPSLRTSGLFLKKYLIAGSVLLSVARQMCWLAHGSAV